MNWLSGQALWAETTSRFLPRIPSFVVLFTVGYSALPWSARAGPVRPYRSQPTLWVDLDVIQRGHWKERLLFVFSPFTKAMKAFPGMEATKVEIPCLSSLDFHGSSLG